jgi:TetR/AcrR family transcriptional regulator, transcriptional repressor for nem operon
MPRSKSYEINQVTERAMLCFWRNGFYATSIDDLVAATGVSRHGIYGEFVDKRGLFVASLATYVTSIVDPAFCQVETTHANLDEIRAYFEMQIDLAEQGGLPGPGCLMANTMTEVAPHDEDFMQLVSHHLQRLRRGFAHALANQRAEWKLPKRSALTSRLADHLTISSQGLWSVSRSIRDASILRSYAADLVAFAEGELNT